MQEIRALLAQIREHRDFSRLLGVIPYARSMGFRVQVDGEVATTIMPFDGKLVGNPSLPALHGGAVGALLESAAIFQLILESRADAVPKIINLTIDYLRSARPEDTFARASITKHGRRVVSVHARAWQRAEQKPVATASAHFLLPGREGE